MPGPLTPRSSRRLSTATGAIRTEEPSMVLAGDAVLAPLLKPSRGAVLMDLDNLLDSGPAYRSGEIALWLAVTIDAFFTVRDGWGYQNRAREWIEDPENFFFEAVADELGYSPDGLRERIQETVKRSGRDQEEIRKRSGRDQEEIGGRHGKTELGGKQGLDIERIPLPRSRLAGYAALSLP